MSPQDAAPARRDACVSVVIPTFRRHETLPLAVRSALAQGPVVLEVIVVDDNRDAADSARVRTIVEELADPRVVLVANRGRSGGSSSRNCGIRQARGEYLAFLDDDDYWLPGKLEAQLARMAPGIAGVDCGYVESDRSWGLRLEIRGEGARRSQRMMLAGYCPTTTSLVMVRTEVARRAGLFEEDMASFEDYDLWLRCAGFGDWTTVPEPLCVYVQHSGFRLSVAMEGRLRGLEQLLERWRAQLGSEEQVEALRRRWTLSAYATASRRSLESDRRASVQLAIGALRIDPASRPGWQALAFAAIGFRAARAVSIAKNRRNQVSPDLEATLRRVEERLRSPEPVR